MALTKIGTDGVKDDAVTSGKIPANAVGSSELADQSVSLDKLPHGTSSNDGKFLRANNGADPTFETISTTPADGSITEAKLANGAVTQTKIGDGSIINAKVDNAAAIAGTKISPDFGSQNIETDGEVRTGSYIKTRVASGGHFYLRNNSTGANFSSHLQTCSGGENSNVQTHIHYYHGGYAELLHQGNSSLRTLSNGVQFRNGGNVIGQISPNGLAFGSDTAAANALDDYEEGNYVPSVTGGGGGSCTLNSSYNNMQYTKIGNWVHVTGRVRVVSENMSGTYIHFTLPFTSANLSEDSGRFLGNVMIQYSDQHPNAYVIHPQNNVNYVQIARGNTGADMASAGDQFSGNELITIAVSYRTA